MDVTSSLEASGFANGPILAYLLPIMQTTAAPTDASAALAPNSSLMEQTRMLCQTILDHPEYKSHMENIESFLADDDAKATYREFSEHGETMHRKQHAGELTQEDITGFEIAQAKLAENPLVNGFMAAQDSLNEIHSAVSMNVAKTLELGHLPQPEDLEPSGGCCGGNSDGGGCCS